MNVDEEVIKSLEEENRYLKEALLNAFECDRSKVCGFCFATGYASAYRHQLRGELLDAWRKPLTWEEIDQFEEKQRSDAKAT